MGAVYRGMDMMLERPVAVKALRSELVDDADLVERFRREAKALAKLNHPNITNIYNFLNHAGEYLIVLEFVEGKTLEQRLIKEGKLSYDAAYRLLSQIVAALGYAHRLGIVHRDIKPANIIETREGTVKVADFGIARILGAKAMTTIGKAPGSVYYASPEQITASENLDARSDVYSLGILLFQMLTDRLPFRGSSVPEIVQKQLETQPPPISKYLPTISPVVESVIKKALEKQPENRFASVEEFFRALPEPSTVNSQQSAVKNSQIEVNKRHTANSHPRAAHGVAQMLPSNIRLTDSRITIDLSSDELPLKLPAAKPRRKKSRFGILVASFVFLLGVFGFAAAALFYFFVLPSLETFR